MGARPVQIAEARRRLSALVDRVARGGGPVVIGRYGHERAVLMGMDDYVHLTRTKRRRRNPAHSLEGSLELPCTPAELEAESRRLGEEWLARIDHLLDEPPTRRRRRRP